jgi:hypothetical protein
VTTYSAFYIASNGQPPNGWQDFTNKRKAIQQARHYRDTCLPDRSGGSACVVIYNGPDAPDESVWAWYEHAEGGYLTAR